MINLTPLEIERWRNYGITHVEREAQRYPCREFITQESGGIASEALTQAMNQFDPAVGAKFKTYYHTKIRGALRHFVRDKARIIRRAGWAQSRKNEHKAPPRIVCVSLDELVEREGDRMVDGEFEGQLLSKVVLQKAIGQLNENEQAAVDYFLQGYTNKEAGKKMGYCAASVSLFRKSGLGKLKEALVQGEI